MRVVQLDFDDHRIEFHPYVTVVRGVDGALRDRFVEAIRSLPRGHATTTGIVEAHGVFLDLDDASLALCDLPNDATNDVDIVVRAEQLQRALGADPLVRSELEHRRAAAAERVVRAEAELERAEFGLAASREALDGAGDREAAGARLEAPRAELARLTEARTALEAKLDAARLAHVHAQKALATADAALAAARERRLGAGGAVQRATEALEAARAGRDPLAHAALDAARDRLRAMEEGDGGAGADADEEPVTDGGEPADPAVVLEQLERRETELEASLLALDTVDPFPVQRALDEMLADRTVETVPSEDAMRLADEWARIEAALRGSTAVGDAGGSVLAAARQRLDAARAALYDAERAVRSPEIDRLDIEALENAHEAVLLAQERAERRFGGDRARQRLEDARAAEQAILDRIGFATYTTFVMGTSIQHVDPEREHRLDAARQELADAEDALARLEEGIDDELARAELRSRRRAVHDEAVALLGHDPGDDLEWTLRHHRVEVSGGGDRALRLRAALEGAGIVLGDEDVSDKLLVDLARIWLDEQQETAAHRAMLEQQLAELEVELTAVRKATRRRRPDDEESADERRAVELEQARAAVHEADQRVQRQARVEEEVARAKAEVEAANAEEQQALAALADAERAESEAARQEHDTAAEQSRLQAEFEAAVEAERDVADALAELTDLLEHVGGGVDRATLEAAVHDARASVDAANDAVAEARHSLAAVEHELEELDARGADGTVTSSAGAVEEIEWYLLSRIASQRAVSFAGSLPFVLDHALTGLEGDALTHVLGRLERMSSAVQVIVLSDDVEVAAWADAIGVERAATLFPEEIEPEPVG